MMYVVYGNKLESEKNMRVSMSAFNVNQSALLGKQSLELAELRKVLPAIVVPVAVSAPVVLPTVLAVAGPQVVAQPVKPQVASASVTQNVKPAPVRPSVQVSREAPRPAMQRPASPQAVATVAAASTSPVGEGAAAPITLEQAGISGIDTTSVRFKSGRQISVGGEFPSGEKLVSVSPGEGKIVTDRRTILLAKPAPAQ